MFIWYIISNFVNNLEMNLILDYDIQILEKGDYLYDNENRKVSIVKKEPSHLLVERFLDTNIRTYSYVLFTDVAKNYTTHKKEEYGDPDDY